jgi:phenylpropionate dioxygenase-like ring-hydroxylating dioxygenase large terminal subunit
MSEGGTVLKQAENELLTRVGPGTAMGAVMRRYWIPVLLREEIPDPDGDPVRVRLLGEDLVAFRDSTGAVGLLGALCPHRGAPLFFGRNERSGLRCMYHGWKFTVDGRCTDMPNVPPASDFKARIRHTSYPCVERHGMVWAYLGPERPVPSFPAMDWTDLPPDHLVASKQLLSCNYAQAMEGDFDPSHISFLHSSLAAFRQFEELAAGGERATAPSPDAGGELTPELEHVYWALDPRPVIMAIETENGLFSGARREAGAGHYYYRFNHFIMPFFAGIPRDAGAQAQVNAWVPVDDETTMVWRITYRPERPLTEQERAEQLSGLDAHVAPGGYLPPTAAPGSRWVPALNRANDYGLDRQAERTTRYAGVPGVWAQDRACTEGMGAIMDRTQEHLASSDLPVIKMRRLLIRVARQLEAAGTEPPGVRTVPRVAAIPTGLYQRDLPWEQVAAAVTEQIRPDERKLQCRQ